ncbi:MAG TPA: hypothetical protein VEY10_21345 [Flavisolibacter sp.]|nr:hypothetical protein [Flavisolibacter sp.]
MREEPAGRHWNTIPDEQRQLVAETVIYQRNEQSTLQRPNIQPRY